MQDDEENFT